MKKIALITGATAGIGRATAHKLAQDNYNLILTGRRQDLLEDLKKELGIKYKCDVLSLVFDVRNNKQVEEFLGTLPEIWKEIDVLVNNAGLAAGLAPVQEGDLADWDQMIDTNVKGLLYVTRVVAPFMIARGHGHIINITSIAGKEVYENGNVYCATKHAVDALTKGFRLDLLKHNIKVTSIAPGMVDTEFSLVRFKGDKDRAVKFYEGFTPLCADDVAEAIFFAVTRPPHVNINDMLIMPAAQANATMTHRVFPENK
ncbi:MAG: SDR family oxidoreductase [Bacteroidota bacterium]|nr:SDR family oxidoreductase [Bacteroidota bacterium]